MKVTYDKSSFGWKRCILRFLELWEKYILTYVKCAKNNNIFVNLNPENLVLWFVYIMKNGYGLSAGCFPMSELFKTGKYHLSFV